jgi:uncharacterized protein (DUF58 family)
MAIDTQELMRQVGRIRFFTSRLVDDRIAGEYHSIFRGRGIEFDEVRDYVPGDDIRSIDWNVTARMGHPFVKRYCEERELTILFLVDISGSMAFGSGPRSKAERAAELACLLALTAIRNQDKVGLMLFSDRIGKHLPARKGRTAVMRLVREMLAAEETRHGTDLAGALRFFNRVQKRKAIVFLISDFLDAPDERELRVTARRHDLIACRVLDPRELELADAGVLEIEDPETGELRELDTASREIRNRFAADAACRAEDRRRLFRRLGIDYLEVRTDRPYIEEVRRLFQVRQKRARRG